ncbi:MAG: hypothetical protein HKN24_01725 [Acidimicrobiales bacterium]|nr:hypothetical protein [Acidimicrobiales bacterium]
MRLGIAHHYGWAVAVTATDEHRVVDRRRIELIEPGHPTAPIHHEGGAYDMHSSGKLLSDDELAELVAEVRSSVEGSIETAFNELAHSLAAPVRSISLRAWPEGFPSGIAELRKPPFDSQADSVMYRQLMADAAQRRGWVVHRFDGATAEGRASELLGPRAEEVLRGPRRTLGPPWNRDHRMALAATVLASIE